MDLKILGGYLYFISSKVLSMEMVPPKRKKITKFTEDSVLESYHYANVIGGQVQIGWAGQILPLNNISGNYCQECQARPAHLKPAYYDIASDVKPQEICPSGTCPLGTYLYGTCPCDMNSSN